MYGHPECSLFLGRRVGSDVSDLKYQILKSGVSLYEFNSVNFCGSFDGEIKVVSATSVDAAIAYRIDGTNSAGGRSNSGWGGITN